MYIELGLECILGWDKIRVRVLFEIILGATESRDINFSDEKCSWKG